MMLEDVMTMDRNALGHTLVRFYLAHGSVVPLLDCLTTREITMTSRLPSSSSLSLLPPSFTTPLLFLSYLGLPSHAILVFCSVGVVNIITGSPPLPFSLTPLANPRTLFRGNSLASKCFDQFMKVLPHTTSAESCAYHMIEQLFLHVY